jgi:hypothetical protein
MMSLTIAYFIESRPFAHQADTKRRLLSGLLGLASKERADASPSASILPGRRGRNTRRRSGLPLTK